MGFKIGLLAVKYLMKGARMSDTVASLQVKSIRLRGLLEVMKIEC